MAPFRLTDLALRALSPPGSGQQTHWDESLPGFGVRVSQGGTKTFIVMHGADRRRISIGRYPVVSLTDARAEAKRLLAEATLGRTRPATISWEKATAEFLEMCDGRNKPRTVAGYRRLLNRHFSSLERMQMAEIRSGDVTRRLDRLKDTPSERHHAYVAVKVFFRWAMRRGYVHANPCDQVQLAPVKSERERALSDAELVTVLRAARGQPFPFGPLVQLIALTGQRRGEIATLQWDWIDTANRTITLPAAATKNRRAHTFPYGDLVAGILERLPRTSEFVFPAARPIARGRETTIFNGWGKAKDALDAAIATALAEQGHGDKLLPHWTLHDLRRTFATQLAALSIPVHVTEKLLNHVSGTISGVAAVYNRHSYMGEMRTAVAAWEARLTALIS
ncbi:MAG: site-specific integrase [Pseudolabrys sp.]|nr:site-specific integrase [Pseudolabrys sp.]MCW5696155.1 site-specific integrase [Bauldia sp.]